ncbi:metallopeptidase TldD-related protein [Gabonibacter chumensis]|uniref:metallopeptidase TldD-related protein n=1 Tax=Gabonibacter chumensis TaxID=2972474 RepID=UPI0025731716|nr:metallopeptidase TldD-related protein [Gabonibacter chumensis]MCR9012716.1 metallopeptidase TldD-related protein [Gabonibacter chumensis]
MKRVKFIYLCCVLGIIGIPGAFAQSGDKLLMILSGELNGHYRELQGEKFPPYYMNYRIIDTWSTTIAASFGVLRDNQSRHTRIMIPHIRIGDSLLDNFSYYPMGAEVSGSGISYAVLPIDDENNEKAIRQAIWMESSSRYAFASDIYERSKAQSKVNVKNEDKSPYFSSAPVESYYEPPFAADRLKVDTRAWIVRLKKISDLFNENMYMTRGDATLTYEVERRYFVDTEGRSVVENLPYARIMIQGSVTALDGMELPLLLSYFAYDPADLPTDEQMIADTREMVKMLAALREAPVAEPYTGPALLSGAASGVFFHEIFGHRLEGQRMKTDEDGQTFKQMVGESVLAPDFQVFDDPTLSRYGGKALNGYYEFDDQGIRSKRVDVVVDGKLRDFLMTRVPIDGFPMTNGHARASDGFDPVSRQSNLCIETKSPKTKEELRRMLVEEVKKQKKEYGYFFKEVTSGLTYTGKGSTNSFNVTPLVVYRVYTDGRPDELVRGVILIGTPLSMFSNIVCAGDDPDVFVGICGAESGNVEVTAISPTILVSKIETQRMAKSSILPPILPRVYFPQK